MTLRPEWVACKNKPDGTTPRESRGGRRICRAAATAGLALGLAFGLTSTANASTVGDDSTPTNGNVHSASWEEGLYGPYLRVVPTPKGRLTATFNPHGTLAEAEKKADEKSGPEKLTAAQQSSLFNQLRCHADGPADFMRSKWDLDAGRPDIGYWSTARHGCNPLPAGQQNDEEE